MVDLPEPERILAIKRELEALKKMTK